MGPDVRGLLWGCCAQNCEKAKGRAEERAASLEQQMLEQATAAEVKACFVTSARAPRGPDRVPCDGLGREEGGGWLATRLAALVLLCESIDLGLINPFAGHSNWGTVRARSSSPAGGGRAHRIKRAAPEAARPAAG